MLLMLQYAFPSPVLHVCFRMLRCSMLLPAAERRPTVTPIYLLFGRPKMLISAYPFAPFFVAL